MLPCCFALPWNHVHSAILLLPLRTVLWYHLGHSLPISDDCCALFWWHVSELHEPSISYFGFPTSYGLWSSSVLQLRRHDIHVDDACAAIFEVPVHRGHA